MGAGLVMGINEWPKYATRALHKWQLATGYVLRGRKRQNFLQTQVIIHRISERVTHDKAVRSARS